MLYQLIINDKELSYDNYKEDFYIGFFKSKEEAKNIAEYYIKNIEGFKDYPCEYRIIEKEVEGNLENKIWMIQGYDINENEDEINIVESKCYTNKELAQKELEKYKNQYKRQEWYISSWIVDKKEYEDGFFRATYKVE